MKQIYWFIVACCLLLAACMSSNTTSKSAENEDVHVAQGHVGHGGGGR